jgi:outer membrane protein TolC
MRPQIVTLLLLTALSPIRLFAQDTLRMSLKDCLDFAEKNQVKIKNAILDEQTFLARNKEVTGLALPHINASAGMTNAPLVAAFQVPNFIKTMIAGDGVHSGLVSNQYLDSATVAGMPNTMSLAFQPKWTTTGSLQASQILFDPSVMVALQARNALEDLARKGVELTIQDVKVSLTKSYYSLQVAEKQKALVQQNIVRIEQLEKELKEMYKTGIAEKLDVDKVTVALNNLKAQKTKIEQMVGLAYFYLKFQIGMPLIQPIKLSDNLSEENLGSELLKENIRFENRYEYQLMEIQKNLYAYDLKRYKLGGLPTIALFGNYGYTMYNSGKPFETGSTWQRSAMVGGNLSLPLFDGFQRKQKVKQAQFTLQKAENNLESMKMAMTLEEQSAKISLSSNILLLNAQRENMKLAEEVYNTTRTKYKEGVGSSLEILNAETALKEAQTNYFSALYEVITSKVELQKVLGQFK